MGWIDSISRGIEKAFETVRPALAPIPALLLLCEMMNRPGLSAIALTAAIIRRLSEAGIPTDVNADGSPNKICQFVRIFCEELVTEIKDNCVVDVASPAQSTISTGIGVGPTGSVSVTVSNMFPISARGIPR